MPNIPVFRDEASWSGMRLAGRLAAQTLDFITPFVKVGATTDFLNTMCQQFIEERGGKPAPLQVGFPKAVCISRNEVVCHGVPGKEKLTEGDIVNIDVSLEFNGWYGDTCRMFFLGNPSPSSKDLVETAQEALRRAITLVKPGIFLGDIGFDIQSFVESKGYSVVRDFCGHGIGLQLHGLPEVAHFGRPGQGIMLKEGMFFTIEPMINRGRYPVKILSDGWTVVTKDGSWSAQFEHSLGVTSKGCEIFTESCSL